MDVMLWWVFVLLIAGGLTAGLIWWSEHRQRPSAPLFEPSPKDKLYDAAFKVIVSSLKSEPEKWQTRSGNGIVYWLVNFETRVAIWVANEAERLFTYKATDFGKMPNKDERIYPPRKWQNKIYEAAAPIILGKLLEREVGRLEELLADFDRGASGLTQGQ